jgi:hypothetical protein
MDESFNILPERFHYPFMNQGVIDGLRLSTLTPKDESECQR